MHFAKFAAASAALFMLVACETTSTAPYSPSTQNVLALQSAFAPTSSKISVGDFTAPDTVDSTPACRAAGPLDMTQGKGIPAYIKEAFQQELFLAQAYAGDAPVTVKATVDRVVVSTFGTGAWEIDLSISSNVSAGYKVSTAYSFSSSFSAVSACRNASDAFAPAIRELLAKVIADPGFKALTTPPAALGS